MVEFTIDGKKVSGEKGESILDVARREGFTIPTLCHHETMGSDGRCRLCVVEMSRGSRKRIVASCLYPIDNGIEVFTESDDVKLARKTVLELLLARCPYSEDIQRLAREYGIQEARYEKDKDKGKCILCNTCVKTCEIIVGVDALSMTGKGPAKKVTTPFDEASDVCIGCGACYIACPTGHIYMEDRGGFRTIWKKRFELAQCTVCGRFHAPVEQLEYISKISGASLDDLMVCQSCK